MKGFLIAAMLITGVTGFAQTPEVWNEYLDDWQNGTTGTILNYSFAGYHFSEKETPDVTQWTYFDITEYGAVADDDQYD
ncbi:MAG: hypothetical protein WBA74_23095, partial [Cyclobacteriaceae bacterium]